VLNSLAQSLRECERVIASGLPRNVGMRLKRNPADASPNKSGAEQVLNRLQLTSNEVELVSANGAESSEVELSILYAQQIGERERRPRISCGVQHPSLLSVFKILNRIA
jgi:hypothetical protein